MIDSFFIITKMGEIIIERHFKEKLPRSVAEKFFDKARKFSSPFEVCPLISIPNYYISHIYRDGMYFIGINRTDMEPLTVTTFLESIYEIFTHYLRKVSVETIKDEIVDHGFTLTTELTLLQDLVRPPPRLFKKLNFSKKEGTGRSIVPWRKTGIKYGQNELFFDLEEYLTAIININSSPTICEIKGQIRTNCFLSGMPDILLQFNNPSLFKHVLFHPCVRYAKYEEDRSVSFIPPDGEFILLTYKVSNLATLPFYCRAQIHFYKSGGNINLVFGAKYKEGSLENVEIEFPIPYPLQLLKKLNCSKGHAAYIPAEKKFRWDIGKVEKDMRSLTCTGQVFFSTSAKKMKAPPAVEVKFKLDKVAWSGLKVDRVEVMREKYKTFKGVKYFTKNGRLEVRTV